MSDNRRYQHFTVVFTPETMEICHDVVLVNQRLIDSGRDPGNYRHIKWPSGFNFE